MLAANTLVPCFSLPKSDASAVRDLYFVKTLYGIPLDFSKISDIAIARPRMGPSLGFVSNVFYSAQNGSESRFRQVRQDGKLSVRSSSTVYFPIIKSHHPVLEEKTR